jgi:hypothetical protein
MEEAAADIIMEVLPLLAAAGDKEDVEVAGMDVEVAAHRRRQGTCV